MRRNGKCSMAVLLALAILFGTLGASTVASAESDSLGASAACEGHTLGTFSGVPACVNENGELHICRKNFPDENFRRYVLMFGATNGYFTIEECENISKINVSNRPVETLRGIEFFTNLLKLDCSNSSLRELNCSKNAALTELTCSGCGLTKLDISNTSLEYLNCSNNLLMLTALDVSDSTTLEYLNCSNNLLTELDVSDNTALEYLSCSNNLLTELDVSDNTALEYLSCSNNLLTELDVSDNTALGYLNCSNNLLTKLNVGDNIVLTKLYCINNQLTELDVSNGTALTELRCDNNQLTKLNVSDNIALVTLYCENNQLTKLDVSTCTALMYLYCGRNQLTKLDVSSNMVLIYLYCEYNQLKKLDVSGNTVLIYLSCGENQLTELDVSNNVALSSLSCGGNQLTELDVSNNAALHNLSCGGSIELPMVSTGNGWAVNLGQVISPENFERITYFHFYGVSHGEWNPQTGIVSFDKKPYSFTYTYNTGHVNHPSMQVTVSLWEAESVCTATINGESFAYATGQEIPLSAVPAYVERGWGYRFAGWSGDTDVIVDANSSTTTITMPERDIVIDAEYLLIGDANQDGGLTLEDALYVSQMAAGNRTEIAAGDIDGDGLISVLDITYMRWYLVGNYIPTK